MHKRISFSWILEFIAAMALMNIGLGISPIQGQSPIIEPILPTITETTIDGKRQTVSSGDISPVEIDLFQRFQRTDAPDEVFSFREEGIGADWSKLTEIIISGGNAELRLYPDDCKLRYFYRKLNEDDLKLLQDFVRNKSIDRLRNYDPENVFDGIGYTYNHLTKEGGYRLSMNNPPEEKERQNESNREYCELVRLFKRLCDADKLKVKYLNALKLPDLKLLYANPRNEIRAVWAKGDDIRVLVGEYQMLEQKWLSLQDGRLGAEVEEPETYPPDAFDREKNDDYARTLGMSKIWGTCQPWQVRIGSNTVRAGCLDEKTEGIWICEKGVKPVRLSDDVIDPQLVTSDGHWLVGTLDKKLTCFDLMEKKTISLDDPEIASSFSALYYLPVQRQFLLVCPRKLGPRLPESVPRSLEQFPATYRLLDPASGKTTALERMEGSMPLRQNMHHPFQLTRRPGVIWAAQKGDGYTMIGEFDTKKFYFFGWMKIDSFEFDSDSMWIDESSQKIYIVFRGHLIQMPLPPPKKIAWQKIAALEHPVLEVNVLSGTDLEIEGVRCRLFGVRVPANEEAKDNAKRFLSKYMEYFGGYFSIYNDWKPINDKDGVPLIWLLGHSNEGWAQEALVRAGLATVDFKGFEDYKFSTPAKDGEKEFDWKECLREAEAAFKAGKKANFTFGWP